MKVRPSYFGHLLGARVALQRSPILRIGSSLKIQIKSFIKEFLMKLTGYIEWKTGILIVVTGKK